MVISVQRIGIMYCLQKHSAQRRSDIWYVLVSIQVWTIFMLALILIVILDTAMCVKHLRVKEIVYEFLKCVWIMLRSLLNQNAPVKYVYFAVFELILAIMLIVYENYITVELVVFREPKPYSDLSDLYKHKHNFFTIQGGFHVC